MNVREFLSFCLQVPKHDILHNKLNTAIQEVSTYYAMLEEREKQAVRSAMIEERSHFCTLFNLFKPFLVKQIRFLFFVSNRFCFSLVL